jgi:hypothetical protein
MEKNMGGRVVASRGFALNGIDRKGNGISFSNAPIENRSVMNDDSSRVLNGSGYTDLKSGI